MNPSEIDWQLREGRDCDGDKFATWIALHGSGRILARVCCPAQNDEFVYSAYFYCKSPEFIDSDECLKFIDAESAKRFVEQALASFDPLEFTKPKESATETDKAAVTANEAPWSALS